MVACEPSKLFATVRVRSPAPFLFKKGNKMKIRVKMFSITPEFCPIDFNDCACCKEAMGTFELKNPALHATDQNFGYIKCRKLEKYVKEGILKK